MVIYLGYSLRNSLKRHSPTLRRSTALHQAGFFAFRLSRGGRVPLRAGHFSPFVLVSSKTSIVSVTLSVSRKFLLRSVAVSHCPFDSVRTFLYQSCPSKARLQL